jgi:hypothetical protein
VLALSSRQRRTADLLFEITGAGSDLGAENDRLPVKVRFENLPTLETAGRGCACGGAEDTFAVVLLPLAFVRGRRSSRRRGL